MGHECRVPALSFWLTWCAILHSCDVLHFSCSQQYVVRCTYKCADDIHFPARRTSPLNRIPSRRLSTFAPDAVAQSTASSCRTSTTMSEGARVTVAPLALSCKTLLRGFSTAQDVLLVMPEDFERQKGLANAYVARVILVKQ